MVTLLCHHVKLKAAVIHYIAVYQGLFGGRQYALEQAMYAQLRGKAASLRKARPCEKPGYGPVVAVRFREEWVAMVGCGVQLKTMEDQSLRTASGESFGSSADVGSKRVCGWEPWAQSCYDSNVRRLVGFAAGT